MTIADFDFETYSEAGYIFDGEKFIGAEKNNKGLKLVGAAAYAEHPSTEVISLAYDLKQGEGPTLWTPGQPLPQDLFSHLATDGTLIEAHNSLFEFFIWFYVCHLKMGWPHLPLYKLRCSVAKAKRFNLPGKLEKAGEVLNAPERKNPEGDALIRALSVPHKPTKTNPSLRLTPETAPEKFFKMYSYNLQDIRAEASLSSLCPELSPFETDVFKLDQVINVRGVAIDMNSVENCINIFRTASEKFLSELKIITGGAVETASEVQKIIGFLAARGVNTRTLDEETVSDLLNQDIPDDCRKILEIRQIMGLSSVKKLFAIKHRVNSDNRLRGLFQYCGGDRTGRFAGRGPQPHNLPASGPDVKHCSCGAFYSKELDKCPTCSTPEYFANDEKWSPEAAEYTLSIISKRDLSILEQYFPKPVKAIAGCLRSLFVAPPGKDFICSDYNAIEGVVIAMLSGEQWRIEVFRSHGKIYEMGASKITGIPFEEIIEHKKQTGEHHPSRKTIGKVSELASGFGGWIGAWMNFGADEFLTEDEIKEAILSWREASPAIVEMWGGQHRKYPDRWEFVPELYGLEGCAVAAILYPGNWYSYNKISYFFDRNSKILFCKLLSGRYIQYHHAELTPSIAKNKEPEFKISYWGTVDEKNGKWDRITTYGGKLFENVVQATARDILVNAMLNLEKHGYQIVLHVHDEIVCEVTEGAGSVEEVERIMGIMPEWASDWPIKAAGGWRGKRYRKD